MARLLVCITALVLLVTACAGQPTQLPGATTVGTAGAASTGGAAPTGAANDGALLGLVPERLGTGITPEGWVQATSGACRIATPSGWTPPDAELGTGPRNPERTVLADLLPIGGAQTFEAAKAAEAPDTFEIALVDDNRVFLKRSDPVVEGLDLVEVVKTPNGYCHLDVRIMPGNVDAQLRTAIQILESLGPAT